MALDYEVSTANGKLHKFTYQRFYNQVFSTSKSGSYTSNGAPSILMTDNRFIVIPKGLYMVEGVLVEIKTNYQHQVTSSVSSVTLYLRYNGSDDSVSIYQSSTIPTSDNLVTNPNGIGYCKLCDVYIDFDTIVYVDHSTSPKLYPDWWNNFGSQLSTMQTTLNTATSDITKLKNNYVVLWTGVLTEGNSITFTEDLSQFNWLFCSINTSTECVAINIDKNSTAMNGVSGFNSGTNNKDQVIYAIGATKAGNGKGLTLNSVRRTEHTGSAVHSLNVAGSISRVIGVF